ncbi:MAG: hypothetical protein K6E29_03505 [Cyanobacteria bacterium RUI128]|nr:hypothetical protein [Cyanobacteria bacterium RUI128]
MLKKTLSIILTILILNLTYTPALAGNKSHKVKDVIVASFVNDLNVNKSTKGQIVQFVTTEDYVNDNNQKIPKGTVFQGKIKSIKHSRWAFRRAKAHIIVKQMTLPNGQIYKVRGFTKPRALKGSMLGNIGKGIIMTPVALVTIVGGGVVILVEAVTIVGLVAVAPTGYAICGAVGKETKGLNCKVEKGRYIPIKFNRGLPVEPTVTQGTPVKLDNDEEIQNPQTSGDKQTEEE